MTGTALAFTLIALLGLQPETSVAADAAITKAACRIPQEELVRTMKGLRLDHSGDIQLFTAEPDYVGSELPHIAPFDYIQEVPMFWYGPGYIKAQGAVKQPAETPDIAPTQADLLGFDAFDPPDGRVLTEALEPASVRQTPPKLIVTYVWDASGMVVLDRWKKNWPYLRSLIPEGTWYDKATIASSPASTAQIHAEMGTGAYPRNHGVVGHHYRIGQEHVSPWRGVPTMPILPTLADLWDRANGNEPKIALSGTVGIHLGMASHGSLWGGGDKDIAILREPDGALSLGVEGVQWRLTANVAPFFEFPSYANELPGIETYFDETDMLDGKKDKKWHDQPLSLDDPETLAGFETPARIPYQQKLVEEVIKREGMGQDDVTDMLMVNNKLIDSLAHIGRGLDGVEMGDAVATQDAYLKRFIAFLNQEVGEGQWAMVLTADHGATPYPTTSGAFVVSPGKIASMIQTEFDKDDDDTPIVGGDLPTSGFVQPTQVFLNRAELEDNHATVEDVAKFIMTMTKQETWQTWAPDPGDAKDRAFSAAIPADMMAGLPCLKSSGSGADGSEDLGQSPAGDAGQEPA